jgi:hypothetical protein
MPNSAQSIRIFWSRGRSHVNSRNALSPHTLLTRLLLFVVFSVSKVCNGFATRSQAVSCHVARSPCQLLNHATCLDSRSRARLQSSARCEGLNCSMRCCFQLDMAQRLTRVARVFPTNTRPAGVVQDGGPREPAAPIHGPDLCPPAAHVREGRGMLSIRCREQEIPGPHSGYRR